MPWNFSTDKDSCCVLGHQKLMIGVSQWIHAEKTPDALNGHFESRAQNKRQLWVQFSFNNHVSLFFQPSLQLH